MKTNMGNVDRIIRLVLAAVLLVLFFTNAVPAIVGYIFLAVAVFFVLTSIFGLCPLYLPFGLSTRAKGKKE